VKPGLVCTAAGLALAAAAPAEAQMFHLYLLCQGEVAAGPGAGKGGAEAPVPTPRAAPETRSAADAGGDKNTADANENIQARTRAVRSALKRGSANLELALRDNNFSAFVQRSNVLPVGERMKYTATQTHYTMTYAPLATSRAYVDWRGGSWLFTWYPPFQKLTATRLSVDRQTGVLEGEMVGPAGEVLGLIDMTCEPKKDGQGPAPRF
jgi:hypothetical protein